MELVFLKHTKYAIIFITCVCKPIPKINIQPACTTSDKSKDQDLAQVMLCMSWESHQYIIIVSTAINDLK